MCDLHIVIDTDDIDLILESVSFPIYQVYRKGDRHENKKDFIFETNLISCIVSEKDWDDFDGQVDDMINFLNKYHIDLQSLKDNYKQIDWQFDLPYISGLSKATHNQDNFLPGELLYLTGRLGIGINLALCNPD